MRIFCSWRALVRAGTVALLTSCAWAGAATGAQAASVTAAPGWEVSPLVYPSHLTPGQRAFIVLAIYNVGKAGSTGPVTVTDTLPAGMTATEAGYFDEPYIQSGLPEGNQWNCSLGNVVTCTSTSEGALPSIPPGQMEWLAIAVHVPAGASGTALNHAIVSGGGALGPASVSDEVSFSSAPSEFGFQRADSWFSSPDGTLDTQAGSHPYSLTTSLVLNNTGDNPVSEPRSITVALPRGLVGNPTSIPRCTSAQLNDHACPADTQVGVDRAALSGPSGFSFAENETPSIEEFGRDFMIAPEFPVYNMVPPPGTPAQLGFSFNGLTTSINTKVRSGSDYGISAVINNILQSQITFNTLTVWGVPADSSHNFQRDGTNGEGGGIEFHVPSHIAPVPFLTLPTACEGPQTFSASTEAWANEGITAPPSEFSFLSHENWRFCSSRG
ncbi:MAG: hypothetical protein H0X28_12655 [Solirubrobacterales bacterium]|nr:hypothetical protein [Solirubrobacterales bacterium]